MTYEISVRQFTDEYYFALGRFIAEFTEIEGAMQTALWHFSEVKSPIAQAVFSGVRADDACNKITRISVAEKWSAARKAEWKVISDRLAILRTLRNDILHYGANWHGQNAWLVTNEMFVHTPEAIRTTPISPTVLADATADLEKLGMHLFMFMFADNMTDLGRVVNEEILKDAWRYIPPPQGGHAGKTRNKPPKPKHRRRSSPG